MDISKSELKNDLKNLAGDIEAAGLDLDDIRHMVNDPKAIETEINEIRKAKSIIRKSIENIVSKTGIDLEIQ